MMEEAAEKEGGCGGAELGGGGTSISPWRRSGTESILLFWRFVVLPTKRQHENNLRFIKKSQHIENIIYYNLLLQEVNYSQPVLCCELTCTIYLGLVEWWKNRYLGYWNCQAMHILRGLGFKEKHLSATS